MERERISHLHHLEAQAFCLNCYKGSHTRLVHMVLPFMVGRKEKGDEQCTAPCIILKNGMMHFDSQFSPPYPLELSIQIISLFFQKN